MREGALGILHCFVERSVPLVLIRSICDSRVKRRSVHFT